MRTICLAMAAIGPLLLIPTHGAKAQTFGGCAFSKATLRFAGTVEETTRCLLRKVRVRGSGADVQPIPAWLTERVGQPFTLNPAQVKRYLQDSGVLDQVTATVTAADKPSVRYFVIHDTSSPEEPGEAFPANLDSSAYSGNNLATGFAGVRNKVNLIIARDGRSRALVGWGNVPRDAAIKIESPNRAPAAKAVFVHVENVQPRLKPAGSSWFWKAPVPGLTSAQETRLAVAYIVASMRAGRWLIPAYHFNIDQGLPQAHDDPQNMDLASWAGKLRTIEAAIVATPVQ